MKTDDLDRMDATARNGAAWPESTQSRADVLTLTAEVRRLIAALADEERASARLLTERDRLTEAIDAIHAMTGCTHEWSNLHSCDACAVEGVSAMVTPGVHADTLHRVRAEGRAAGLREALDACSSVKGRLLDKAMEGGGSVACDEAFGEGDEHDADEDECEFIAAGASLCGEAVEALLAKGGGA